MKEAGSERVRGQESVGLECLQRCEIHGCENLTWGGGVCNRCAEEINGLRETYARIDARRKGTAYAGWESSRRPARAWRCWWRSCL